MVNLHFSLLPRWRGAAPVERAILAGDHETGVCLMKVEEGLDTGPVYAVRTVPLDDDITLAALRDRAGGGGQRARRGCAGRRCRRAARPRAAGGRGHHGGEDHQGGPPPRLDGAGRRAQAGRAPGPGLDDVPGQAADRARRRAERRASTAPPGVRPARSTARSWRRAAAPWCCNGCSPRAVLPCQPTSGCAACGLRSASVSGRTRHEGGDRDSDRRVEPRPVRAVPFGTPAALRRPADAVPPRPRRAHRRSRVRHR